MAYRRRNVAAPVEAIAGGGATARHFIEVIVEIVVEAGAAILRRRGGQSVTRCIIGVGKGAGGRVGVGCVLQAIQAIVIVGDAAPEHTARWDRCVPCPGRAVVVVIPRRDLGQVATGRVHGVNIIVRIGTARCFTV